MPSWAIAGISGAVKAHFYDRQGKPMEDLESWSRLMSDQEYYRVAETVLPDGAWVSTVWLGFNHGASSARPIIFETMVFKGPGTSGGSLDCSRYATEGEARAGHEAMVAKWSTKH